MSSFDLHCVTLPDYVLRERAYPPGLRLPRHDHDFSNITVVIDGAIEEITDAGEHVGYSGGVVAKPAGSVHANRVRAGGARTLAIELTPRSRFAREIERGAWSWTVDARQACAALAVYRALYTASSTTELDARVAELVVAVTTVAAAGAAPAWVASAKSLLDGCFCQSIKFADIAGELGLHPVYLSRAFRLYTGTSMTEYVRSLRLRDARRLLADSTGTLALVAAESGFADESHLSRVFRRAMHVTPGVYRRVCNPRESKDGSSGGLSGG